MDKNVEEKFVKIFIKKDKQDRILFELFSPKKRADAINKLSNLITDKYIILCSSKTTDSEILQIIQQEKDLKKCYFMSDRSIHDGEYMGYKDALKIVLYEAFTSVLIFNENLVFLKDEAAMSSPLKIILRYRK